MSCPLCFNATSHTIPLSIVDIDDRLMTDDKALNLAMLPNNLNLPVPSGNVGKFHSTKDEYPKNLTL